MTDWPPVWVLFCTYKRTVMSVEAIKSLRYYLKYPNLHFHICDDGSRMADDGSSRAHIDVLAEAFETDVTAHEMLTPAGEFNLGGNANRGMEIANQHGANIYLILCDDDALAEPWDIWPHVDLLDSLPEIGAIRCAHLSEGMGVLVTSHNSERLERCYSWGRIIRDWSFHNPWQTQSYLYIFDTFLVHKRFFDAYGLIPEHLNPGLTEVEMCRKYNDSPLGEAGPQIYIPLGLAPGSPWVHIGKGKRGYSYLAETAYTYREDEE